MINAVAATAAIEKCESAARKIARNIKRGPFDAAAMVMNRMVRGSGNPN
jgi:hypothetical protein